MMRRRILRKLKPKGTSPRSTRITIEEYVERCRAIVLEYEQESRLYVLTYRWRFGIARQCQLVFFNKMDALTVYRALERGAIQ